VSSSACALCGGETAAGLPATDRNRHLSAERFDYRTCRACGTVQLVPPPADLDRYYPSSYYTLPADRATLLAASGPEGYKRDLVARFAGPGRLLEIGPAAGGFLVVMQEAGYDCSAIEMDADCCRHLSDVVGVDAHRSDDPAAALAGLGPFDVIALWQVIEHVPDPAGVLAAAARALAPGGIVILGTPNPDSLQFRLLRARWVHLDAPRHLYLIPSSELVREAQELGLQVALMTTRDVGTRTWNLFGWRESFAGAAGRPRARAALRVAGSIVARLMAPIERREGHGATYTLVLSRTS
jgi:SAM-dependent methyltransferase